MQVPNVSGKQFADASNDLIGQGLKVTRKDVPSGQAAGVVTDQNPKAFTTVRTGRDRHPLGIDRQAARSPTSRTRSSPTRSASLNNPRLERQPDPDHRADD
mgnify:CR=1 FL=1